MKRREFIAGLGGAAAWPLVARAQQPPFLVGMIGRSANWHHFRDGMRDLGYTEGQNVKYELRTDEIEPARLAEDAKELASIPVDVIVAFGSSATQAAQAATKNIPIVMVAVGDPVRVGFVGNLTGTSFLGPDVQGKRLQLLKQVLPSAVRVALLFNPNNAGNVLARNEIETAARELGISLVQVEASSVSDLDAKLSGLLIQRPDALIAAGTDRLFELEIRKIIGFLESNQIPGMFQAREYALAGGLMSYGANFSDLFRRSATYVHKILQGTKPSDLPVEQPTKFELILNLKTAKALGLSISNQIQLLADEVIE
jgi:putative tryptophan/tyrosine transport system substrate-binding protein